MMHVLLELQVGTMRVVVSEPNALARTFSLPNPENVTGQMYFGDLLTQTKSDLCNLSVRCRRPHRGTPKPPSLKGTLSKPSSSPPSTLDALNDDADTTFDLPSFQDFAGLKGSAFKESIETLEEMANREPSFEPYHESSFGPSIHPSDTVFASEPRENGKECCTQ